jgi:hypothetical protein
MRAHEERATPRRMSDPRGAAPRERLSRIRSDRRECSCLCLLTRAGDQLH